MKRHARWGIALVATASLVIVAAGCSGGDDSGDSGKVQITFMPYQPDTEGIVAAFEKANPDIDVKSTPRGDSYADVLKTRVAGGQTPDVFQITAEGRTDILKNKLALDLSGEDFLSTVDPAFLPLYAEGKAVYGITFTAWMGGIVYNKDILKDAGFDEFPETVDGVVKLAKALEAENVVPYYEDQSFASASLTAILASSQIAKGEKITDFALDGKPSKETFAKGWRDGLDAWQKLIDSGFLAKDSLSLDSNQIKSAFLNGQVAAYRSGNWDVTDLDKAGINYGFAPFPSVEGGAPFINGGGDPPFAIAASTSPEKQAAAKKFLAFLASEEGVKLQSESTGGLSISSNFTSQPAPEFVDAYENSLRAGNYYWLDFTTKAAVLIETMSANQQLVLQGEQTPSGFADAMDAAAK